MALTLKEALRLKQKTLLTFGNDEHTFTVVSIKRTDGIRGKTGAGVYIALLRDDGYETFATENDLDVANIVTDKQEAEPTESDVDDDPTVRLPDNEKGRTPKAKAK